MGGRAASPLDPHRQTYGFIMGNTIFMFADIFVFDGKIINFVHSPNRQTYGFIMGNKMFMFDLTYLSLMFL